MTKKNIKTFKKWWVYLPVAAVILLMIFRVLFQGLSLEKCIRKLNMRLTYFEVMSKPKFSILGQGPMEEYEIKLRQEYSGKIQYFDSKMYTIQNIERPDLCAIIDTIQNTGSEKIIDVLKRMNINADISLGKIVNLKADGLQYLIPELQCILGVVGKDYPVDIYIRGFADGYRTEWEGTIKNNPVYSYDSIPYLPTIDIGLESPFRYASKESFYHLPKNGTYTNKDLPNLRAMFVKKQVVEPLIEDSTCSKKVSSVHILDGFEYEKNTHDSMLRKVQIFICNKKGG